ncbi:DotD/TraH family lipoprotein (plasmid) [Xenorhabdus stockiae]|uniref:DotD/TraH family lipoprotein n=1 Tax=Xenorhabdus stockiae TaxID=351614 RepID=UPI003CFABEAB
MIKRLTFFITISVILVGCKNAPPPQQQPPSQLTITIKELQQHRQELHQRGVLEKAVTQFPAKIHNNSQHISVNWDGDAIELLSQMAHQRGLNFAYTGIRLPLPVTVHEQDISFEDLLRIIRTQIDWRAQLEQNTSELRLYFMLPLKKGALA